MVSTVADMAGWVCVPQDGWSPSNGKKDSPESENHVREPASPSVQEATLKAPSQVTTGSGSDTMGSGQGGAASLGSGRLGVDGVPLRDSSGGSMAPLHGSRNSGSHRSKAGPSGLASNGYGSSGHGSNGHGDPRRPSARGGNYGHRDSSRPAGDGSSGEGGSGGNGGSGGSHAGNGPAGGRNSDEYRSSSEPEHSPPSSKDGNPGYGARGGLGMAQAPPPWLAYGPPLAPPWQTYHQSAHQDALMQSYMDAYNMQYMSAAMAARYSSLAGKERHASPPLPKQSLPFSSSWGMMPPEHRHRGRED